MFTYIILYFHNIAYSITSRGKMQRHFRINFLRESMIFLLLLHTVSNRNGGTLQMTKHSAQFSKHAALWIFYPLFFLAWALVQLLLVPVLEARISSETVRVLLTDVLLKNLIWTLPALLLIRHFADRAYVPPKELFHLRSKNALWLLTVPVAACYALLLSGDFQSLNDRASLTLPTVLVVLFVGLTEETVFRGWMLNTTYAKTHPYAAVAVNALLFLAIHLPKWIRQGTCAAMFLSGGFLTILLLSVCFSVLFLKSKSLIVPILTHSAYDLVILMLEYGGCVYD